MAKDRELPPPLEMLCMNALWEIAEGNVEDVRRVVSRNRPLAYTTVLTLLDRLVRRGAVSRRKEGRSFRYQPIVQRDRLRRVALRQFLEYHFEGSEAKLRLFLEAPPPEAADCESAMERESIFERETAFERQTASVADLDDTLGITQVVREEAPFEPQE